MSLEKVLKFKSLAEAAALYSKDTSTKVGAVALDDDCNVLCVGYNGKPRGVLETIERSARPLKYKFTAHAEENLVAQAARIGTSLKGSTIIVTSLHPCTTCTRLMIQAGVKRIIANKSPEHAEPIWKEEEIYSKEMLDEAGVEVVYLS